MQGFSGLTVVDEGLRFESTLNQRDLNRTVGLRVQGSGFRVQISGFRVQGAGFMVQGSSGLRVVDGG